MKHVLCLDVGGTTTRLAVATINDLPASQPELIERTYQEVPTPPELEGLGLCAKSAIGSFTDDPDWIDGYACAIAASIEGHAIVRRSASVPFLLGKKQFPLAQEAQKIFGSPAPVVLANDMEAALAGEVAVGALRGCLWGFMDTISTGWGGAMLYNGMAVATEPGHVWVGPSSSSLGTCGCGRSSCAERYYSGGAVRQHVTREVELTADCRGDSSYRVPRDMDPCAFADAEYRKATPWACLLYHQVAVAIGEIWGSRLNLCPLVQKIVYMGTFAERLFALPGILDLVRERMIERSLFQGAHARMPIVRAEARHGALLGAARIFRRLVAT